MGRLKKGFGRLMTLLGYLFFFLAIFLRQSRLGCQQLLANLVDKIEREINAKRTLLMCGTVTMSTLRRQTLAEDIHIFLWLIIPGGEGRHAGHCRGFVFAELLLLRFQIGAGRTWHTGRKTPYCDYQLRFVF